jgi:hypothetical protein
VLRIQTRAGRDLVSPHDLRKMRLPLRGTKGDARGSVCACPPLVFHLREFAFHLRKPDLSPVVSPPPPRFGLINCRPFLSYFVVNLPLFQAITSRSSSTLSVSFPVSEKVAPPASRPPHFAFSTSPAPPSMSLADQGAHALAPMHTDESRTPNNCARVGLARLLDCTDADLAAIFGFPNAPHYDQIVTWFDFLVRLDKTCRYRSRRDDLDLHVVKQIAGEHIGPPQRLFVDLEWTNHCLADGAFVAAGGHAVVVEVEQHKYTTRDYQWREGRPFPLGQNYYQYDNELYPGCQQGTHRIRSLLWMESPVEARHWAGQQVAAFRARRLQRYAVQVVENLLMSDQPLPLS